MYGHYTDRACRVLLEMRTEAFLSDHDHTGSEHLVVAVAKVRDAVTAPVLQRFGVDADRLRSEMRKIVSPGTDDAAGSAQIRFVASETGSVVTPAGTTHEVDEVAKPRTFTPRLFKCLALADIEAETLGDESVGPEHLLLGVLREGKGVGVRALGVLGVDAGALRTAVFEQIAESPEASDTSAPEPSAAERESWSQVRRMAAQAGMEPDDRVVFKFDEATHVARVLDGLARCLTDGDEDVAWAVTREIADSYLRGAPEAEPVELTDQQKRDIISSIVSSLRNHATMQLDK